MRRFTPRAVFSLFLLFIHQEGNATRYLPMIVWDHLNPLLSCKWNWFHDANSKEPSTMEIYDRLDFVCPSLLINVRLLDSYSRPKDQMNLNIFMRKWKGTIAELKVAMGNDSFCDPLHPDTKKVYTCRDGQEGKAYTARFAKDEGFYTGDIVVFFNNGDDGREETLDSTAKKCAMAFVAEVTWSPTGKAKTYDFTYFKEMNETSKYCKKVNIAPQLTTTSSPVNTIINSTPTKITASTINSSTSLNSMSPSPTTSQTSTPRLTTCQIVTPSPTTSQIIRSPTLNASCPSQTARKPPGNESTDECHKCVYAVLIGVGFLLFLNVIVFLIYYKKCRTPKKKIKASCVCMQYRNGESASTVINNVGSEPEALPRKDRPPSYDSQGINNKGFHGTMSRDSVLIEQTL